VNAREEARRGDWVRVGWTILDAGERAPQVPEDTAKVPLEAVAEGWLDVDEARIGDEAWIRTAAGRRIAGRLVEIRPAPGHGFGEPVQELLAIGPKLRERLNRAGRNGEEPAGADSRRPA
jgi:2-amino-4-ketopentanoate thiolase alpha subunit